LPVDFCIATIKTTHRVYSNYPMIKLIGLQLLSKILISSGVCFVMNEKGNFFWRRSIFF